MKTLMFKIISGERLIIPFKQPLQILKQKYIKYKKA